MSASRSAVPVSPTVTLRSPQASLSNADATPALLAHKSEGYGRDGEGEETKGLVKTTTLATSRSAISLTPRITFKSLSIADGTPFAPSPLVSETTPERNFGRRRPQSRVIHSVSNGELQKASGEQGLPGGSTSPAPMKPPPRVHAAAVGPTARAGPTATVVASTGESCGDNGGGSGKSAPDTATTVAQTLANGRPGASSGSAISRRSDTQRESAAGPLVSREPPTKSRASTPHEARTSDTPNTTSSPLDLSASLTAVEGIARIDIPRIGFVPMEATAPKLAGEESPAATSHPETAQSSESKGESQEVKSPEVCGGSDQDTVGSRVKPTEDKVGTPGTMDEDGTPNTLQDNKMVRPGKCVFLFLLVL